MQRRRIIFSGRVQGVGFRATAREAAGAHAITGCVQNLGDGTVLLEAQGEPGEIDRFLADLRSRTGRNIDREQAMDMRPLHAERGFAIRS